MPLLNAGASTFYTNTIASTSDGDYYEMRENGGVTVQISGTWSGTLSFQQSNDAVTWTTVGALLAPGSGGVQVTSTTSNGLWFMVVQARYFRVAPTSWSSGTANVLVRFVSDGSINYSFSGSSATGANSDQIQGSAASGATDAGNPVKIGGVFNTTQPTFTNGQRGDAQLDTRGNLSVYISGKNTNSGAAVVTPADGAGTSGGLATHSQNMTFNGATWDRQRKANATSRIPSAAATTNATVAKAARESYFNTISNVDASTSNTDSLLKQLGYYHECIEQQTYTHFKEVRTILNAEQQRSFDKVIQDVLRQLPEQPRVKGDIPGPGRPEPGMGDGPPPPGAGGPPPM